MENLNTEVEKFAKSQRVDLSDTPLDAMNDKESLKFSREIVQAYRAPDSLQFKAVNDAVFTIEKKYNLSPGLIRAWAESIVSHVEDNGTMSEASYYAKPKTERGREMLMILEEGKRADPAGFDDYCKMMSKIIMKYKDIMPPEYVAKAQGNLQQEGFTERDFDAVDSSDPGQIWRLVLTDHREEMAKHVAEWFVVDWPRYTTPKDVNNSISDCARFITNKYALEWGMQNSVKGLINDNFRESFQNSVEKAKKDYPNDPEKAEKNISDSLQKDLEDYYKKHYLS
ncbi:MAG: hypothetical protein WC269_00225 [Candidatus Gracilibacteria bacterium]